MDPVSWVTDSSAAINELHERQRLFSRQDDQRNVQRCTMDDGAWSAKKRIWWLSTKRPDWLSRLVDWSRTHGHHLLAVWRPICDCNVMKCMCGNVVQKLNDENRDICFELVIPDRDRYTFNLIIRFPQMLFAARGAHTPILMCMLFKSCLFQT